MNEVLNTYYFFYCIKDDDIDGYNVIHKDVLEIKSKDKNEARTQAKEIMFNKHPDVPKSFRKTSGKYFYLTDGYKSDYIEIEPFECKLCGKKVEAYRGLKNKYLSDGFCCCEHYIGYQQIKRDIYTKELNAYLDEDYTNNQWISNNVSYEKGYIYLITNKVTKKVYVGQTIQTPLFRWWQHLKSDENKFERKDLDDLTFEVIEIVNGENIDELKKKLFDREDYYIKKYNSLAPNGYNLTNAKKRECDLRQLIFDLDEEIKNE